MPTLEEIISSDLGLAGGSEKTAADNQATDPAMEALAAELGLFQDSEKTAGDDNETRQGASTEKTAGMGNIYADLFPDDPLDTDTHGSEKTAEQEKLAAEEALGARAYDYFAARFDARIEKLAAETLAGGATISSPKDSIGSNDDNPHGDGRPAQAMPGNRPGDAGSKIDTTPSVTNLVKAQSGSEVVGDEDQKSAPEKYAMAMRKHLLLAQLSQ